MTPDESEARTVCTSCGIPWDQHLGIIGTCQRLQNVKRVKRYKLAYGKLREYANGPWVKLEDVEAVAEGRDAK